MNDQTIFYMAITDIDQLIRQLPITSSVVQIVYNQLSQEQKKQPANCYALLYWYYCFTRLRDYYRQRAAQQQPDPEDFFQFSVDFSIIMNRSLLFAIKYRMSTGFGSKSNFIHIILPMPLFNCHHSSPLTLQIQSETQFPRYTLLRTRAVTSRLCK